MQAALRAFQSSIEMDSDAVPSDFQFHIEVAPATGNQHFAIRPLFVENSHHRCFESITMTRPSIGLRRLSRTVAASVLVMLLAACGGGNPSTDTNALPEGKAARLEVQPAALMLTAAGERRPLGVRAFDADGREVRTQVVWRSTRPEQVSIDAAGTVEARSALGATQVIAEADGVQSAPVLVSTVELASGVTLVDDSQIVSDPTPVDPNAAPDPDNPYEVLISGIALPAVGSVLLGREGKAVGGEVLSAQVEGTAVRVRLRLVEVTRLVKNARISEVIDLSRLPLEVPPEIAALYDVKLVGDEHVFTPKPVAAAAQALTMQPDRKRALSASGPGGRARPAKLTEFNLGPFKCEFATPELPIALGQPAQFSLKFEPQLEVVFDDQGLRKLLLKGVLGAKVKTALVINAAGLLNFTCEAKLYKREQKFPGYLGLLLTGELAAGVGFELEATASVPLVGVEMTAETKGPFEIGLDCAVGECRVVREYNPVSTFTPKLLVPQTALLRSEAFLFGYGWAKLKTGATFLENLRADVITARGGVKFEGNFAPVSTQVAPVEVDYRSDYKVVLLAEVAAGSINKAGESAFRKLLLKLGIFKFSTLKTQVTKTLATSPKGSLTMDRDVFADGDTLAFQVTLDPATIDFPVVGYNVQRVRVFRSVAGKAAREVASVDAQPGQTSLDLSWVAEGTAAEGPGEFFAFVDTVLPTPFSLELGKAQVQVVTETKSSVKYRLRSDVILGSFLNSVEPPCGRQRDSTLKTATLPFSDSLPVCPQVTNRISATQTQDSGQTTIVVSGAIGVNADHTDDPRIGNAPAHASATASADFFMSIDIQKTSVITVSVPPVLPANFITDQLSPSVINDIRVSWGITFSGSGIVRFNAEARVEDVDTSFSPLVTQLGSSLVVSETKTVPPGRYDIYVEAFARCDSEKSACSASGSGEFGRVSITPVSPRVDLVLTLIAPAFAEPEGLLTYAVNLVNRGAGAATVVRAEFSLPQGFSIIGTTGWSGCVTAGTSAVCQASGMAAGEQRAFLIDVKAPATAGSYTVRGRVSSAEIDANFTDNHAQAVTDIPD